jgi:hypothetical protein
VDALRRTSRTARVAALLSLGSLAVHELRYLLAYGDRAGQALAEQGHGYLSDLGGALAALGLGVLLATLFAGALSPPARRERASRSAALVGKAARYAIALAAIFCVQELAEGMLTAGHPEGPAAILANGGWMAMPLAVAAGALCSLVCLALAQVESTVARVIRANRPPRRPGAPAQRIPALTGLSPALLELGLAAPSRAPPPPLAR